MKRSNWQFYRDSIELLDASFCASWWLISNFKISFSLIGVATKNKLRWITYLYSMTRFLNIFKLLLIVRVCSLSICLIYNAKSLPSYCLSNERAQNNWFSCVAHYKGYYVVHHYVILYIGINNEHTVYW